MNDLKDYSPLTWVIERAFRALQLASPHTWWLGSRADVGQPDLTTTRDRARKTDGYVALWIGVEVVLAGLIWVLPEVGGSARQRWSWAVFGSSTSSRA
jgi:hypothetical protein